MTSDIEDTMEATSNIQPEHNNTVTTSATNIDGSLALERDIQWKCFKNNVDIEKRKYLEDNLPWGFNYEVIQFEPYQEDKITNDISCESKFKATILVSVTSTDGVKEFMDSFGSLTNTEYNLSHTDRFDLKTYLWSGSRKCVHNVRKRRDTDKDKSKGKNTQCGAKYSFQLSRAKQQHEQNLLKIIIDYNHNHSIMAACAYRYHEVQQSTKEEFIKLFKMGLSPSSAYSEYKSNLQRQHGPSFVRIAADRRLMPDYRWAFSQYAIFKQKLYGTINTPESWQLVEQRAADYNDKNGGETLCRVKQLGHGDFVVACVDKLCQRVHRLVPGAADIMWMDATGELNNNNKHFEPVLVCCGSF